MIIDLILDRKGAEENDSISVSYFRLDSFYVPVLSLYPADEIPADLQNYFCYRYSPHAFYTEIMGYGRIGHDITRAMDYGEEADVKKSLCAYIDEQDYNPGIKDYINSVNWL